VRTLPPGYPAGQTGQPSVPGIRSLIITPPHGALQQMGTVPNRILTQIGYAAP